jgi:hydroxymethylbilane synthase
MILGTTSNRLALARTNIVLKRMTDAHPLESVELKIIGPASSPLEQHGSSQKNGDINTLLEKMRSGEIDAAAIGVDEIPVQFQDLSEIAAVLPRGPVEDVLVSTLPLERMRPGSVIGVSSVRQKCMLLNLRPDLIGRDLKDMDAVGMEKDGTFDGFIVSRSGKEILRLDYPGFVLDPSQFIPAPGQGAIAVLCLTSSPFRSMISEFDDHTTRVCVESEMSLMRSLGVDVPVPVGIWAVIKENDLRIRAIVLDADGMTSFGLDRNVDLDHLDERLEAFAKELKYSWELVK